MLENLPKDQSEREKLLQDRDFTLQLSNNNESIRSNNNVNSAGGRGAGAVRSDHTYDTFGDETSAKTNLILSGNFDRDNNDAQFSSRQTIQKPKLKLTQKTVGLKRVSFGSSKGSMVETLVFETPTPLSELVEPSISFGLENQCRDSPSCGTTNQVADDSGIDLQEESERSIVRVSIYQSNQPQQIYPPDYLTRLEDQFDSISEVNYNLEDIMANSTVVNGYDRQQSTDSGWDNPFRPGGDLSREADEIVSMIRGGKPITPTEEPSLGNGTTKIGNAGDVSTNEATEGTVTKTNITQTKSAQNGSQHPSTAQAPMHSDNNGLSSQAQVSKQVVPGPTSASHVVIDEKKNKKKGCCVIQ